ncbi:hypothetical protein J2752_000006 [Halarchaeum rubridurum]|uniref:Uncharacterized protein n=1 Tax=Halarchaeum rubridurum TaxID=489911 RepID=A0A8T4GJ01_9EURY|nr:hypothetical protein [Halarchaeum rubridurum]MBP1953125.1 hypothetical protein [Halarchaeum rubridurum]
MTGRRRRDGRLWAALFCRLFGDGSEEAADDDATTATAGDGA